MDCTFYRPTKTNVEEFNMITSKLHNDLMDISKGYAREPELRDYAAKLIMEQNDLPRNPKMGFWGLSEPETMPADARVDFFYMPTYKSVGILMNCKLNYPHIAEELPGFEETLKKGLLASTGRGFQGSGHDNIQGLIETLHVFIAAKAHIYIEKFPNDCTEFTQLFKESINGIEQALLTGQTKGDWMEDYSVQYRCILQSLDPAAYLNIDKLLKEKEVNIFVYGTLMKKNGKGQTYLDDAKFLGECTLKGYALYDLGYYPGIVENSNEMVKGELYAVSGDQLPDIDRYEGEGSLYKRKLVQVHSEDHGVVNSFVYVYNRSTAGKVKVNYEHQPWFEGITNNLNPHHLVWYASYGSNINKKRFMKYIVNCQDKTPPKDERPLILDHPIYFSNHSPTWNNQGVAFLDLQKKGKAYGKMYLITEQQFMDIHEQEGRAKDWYNEKVELGYENGIPMITFTHTPRHREDVIPSLAYLGVIKKGIQETYPELSEEDIDLYLMERYLTADMSNILRYLREQEHGVKITQLNEAFHNQRTHVINVIHNLKELGLIKQDSRTVRAGLDWDSDDAIYYTVPDRRRTIDAII